MAFRIDWHAQIPLRDGVRLNATIYRPLPDDEPCPVVLTMTPYTADINHERGAYFANRGIAFASVDVRGRGTSEGEYEPFLNERRDGHDIVEWLAAQPWCTGRIGMWGGSYAGMTQWYTAAEGTPHLTTIVPTACAVLGQEMPQHGGVYYSYHMSLLTLTSGKTAQWHAFADNAYWHDQYKRMYLEHTPFGDLDKIVGNTTTKWRTWIAHQDRDAYWESINPQVGSFEKIHVPVLTITGLYDDCLVGSLDFYRKHLAEVPEEIGRDHHLLIGPWDHHGTRSPQPHIGDLQFGPQAMLDLNALHSAWYTWTLGKGEKPAFFQDRIAYYVTGLEEWRFASTLEEITTLRRTLFLHSREGAAHDVFASGLLVEDERQVSPPATYAYDPLDTRPADLFQPQDLNNPTTLFDQTIPLNLFGNGLVYHSAPLDEDLMLAGIPEVHLWISIDVPDTDFRVGIYQVMPNGRTLLLGEDFLRARYRESPREERFAVPGVPCEYVFRYLTLNSRKIEKYSRFRFVVSCPNSMFEQKNYNSGGDVMWETAKDAQTAHVTLYHEAPYASYMELPLGDLTAKRRLEERDAFPWFSNPALSSRHNA